MSYNDVYLQLFLISIGMYCFGIILTKLLAIKKDVKEEMRKKAENLQERMRNAQLMGDPVMNQQLQMEALQIMKSLMKKQLGPMGIRCIITLGVFILLNFIYNPEYGASSGFFYGAGWFWLYFVYNLLISFGVLGVRLLIKKITGSEKKKDTFAKDILKMLNPQGTSLMRTPGGHMAPPLYTSSSTIPSVLPENIGHVEGLEDLEDNQPEPEVSDSWKDKIQQKDPE